MCPVCQRDNHTQDDLLLICSDHYTKAFTKLDLKQSHLKSASDCRGKVVSSGPVQGLRLSIRKRVGCGRVTYLLLQLTWDEFCFAGRMRPCGLYG